jgi:hypothetical protein
MITFFSVPKAFNGQTKKNQRNAILSWKHLCPKCEIILLGNEEGTDKFSKEFNILNISEIKKNEFGTPLIDDVFEKAQKRAKYNILVYVNGDIILTNDFLKVAERIKEEKFLIVGRRTDLNSFSFIDFQEEEWEKKLMMEVKKNGKIHGPSGIDYFIFSKGLWKKIPPFALGRTCWDNWLLYEACRLGAVLIDASQVITAVHQNHDYFHHSGGKMGVWKGSEAVKNLRLAGGISHLFTIRDSELILSAEGLKKAKITIYRIISFPFRYFGKAPFFIKILLFPGWFFLILIRKIRRYFDNY